MNPASEPVHVLLPAEILASLIKKAEAKDVTFTELMAQFARPDNAADLLRYAVQRHRPGEDEWYAVPSYLPYLYSINVFGGEEPEVNLWMRDAESSPMKQVDLCFPDDKASLEAACDEFGRFMDSRLVCPAATRGRKGIHVADLRHAMSEDCFPSIEVWAEEDQGDLLNLSFSGLDGKEFRSITITGSNGPGKLSIHIHDGESNLLFGGDL